ncbi:MAG: hypothetical protein ACR2LK_05045 [Solirubrobacteraceae bacterium]
MIKSGSPHVRMILVTVLACLALLAALWLLVISPKRSESAEVRDNVAAQELRLTTAKAKLVSNEQAREDYAKNLRVLKRLDKAVPSRGAIAELLRQLQKKANTRNSDLRLAALKPAAAPAAAATQAAGPAAPTTPGASAPGPGGVATLPFTFTYTGGYFDLVKVLKAARRAVTASTGNLKIDGRLVTIEGLTFQRATPESPLIKASVSGTAYIAAMPPTPTAVVPASATTPGGS